MYIYSDKSKPPMEVKTLAIHIADYFGISLGTFLFAFSTLDDWEKFILFLCTTALVILRINAMVLDNEKKKMDIDFEREKHPLSKPHKTKSIWHYIIIIGVVSIFWILFYLGLQIK